MYCHKLTLPAADPTMMTGHFGKWDHEGVSWWLWHCHTNHQIAIDASGGSYVYEFTRRRHVSA
jgi:hypothetical protein